MNLLDYLPFIDILCLEGDYGSFNPDFDCLGTKPIEFLNYGKN